jgi:PAS domain S-box-containing protein
MGTVGLEVSSEFIQKNTAGFFWTFLITSIGILVLMATAFFFAIRQLITSNLKKIQAAIQGYATGQSSSFAHIASIKEFQPIYDLLDYMSATIESQMVTLNRTLYGVENSNIGIYIVNQEGFISYSNKKAAEQLGFRRHELTDRKFSDLDPGWAQRPWEENNGQSMSYQTAFQHKDLSLISVEVYASKFKLDQEELVFCFVEDISLREKARHAMMASEERFYTFMNNAPFFAYIKDKNLEHIFVNQKTKELRQNMESNNARGLFDAPTAERLEQADREILEGKTERIDLEFEVEQKGRKLWIRDIKFPIRQADGSRIIGGLGIDISRQKEYESELMEAKNLAEAANRVKSDFLANMSHELRTPLNGLLGMINLLQAEELSPSGQSYLDIAVLSAQKMHTIVEDLITLADLENQEPALFGEIVDVKEQIKSVCDGLTNSLRQKDLGLDLYLPEGEVQLKTIPARLYQIFLGLVTNAVKFSDRGTITVKLIQRERGIEFIVADQGIGIPQERISEIFEPLRQLEDPYTKKHGGIGAGLSIVKKTLDSLDGRIEVESKVGEGTTFRVHLSHLKEHPKEAHPGQSIPIPPRPEAHPGKPQVLIVEDEAVNRLYLEKILARFGCEVHEAVDGYEALTWCENQRPDLIFMDIGLPELNGLETTARIRQLPSMQEIPVVALTAHTHPEDVASFLDGGLDQVVKKPFMEGQIRLVLEEFLGKELWSSASPRAK